MGNLCSGRPPVEVLSPSRPEVTLSSKGDLKISSSLFVKENFDSFYTVYKLDKAPIGSGGFAEVWLCTHRRTEEVRAVKILSKSGISVEDIKNRTVFLEVEILKTLDHPNIVKVYEYFEDEQNYYIVMEYCKGGDVFGKLEDEGTFTERYAAKTMKFLLSGLCYLHSVQIVHRDIKPENLLISSKESFEEYSIKIIDFNISTRKSTAKLNEVTGTTDFMAPEVFRGIYDEKCDVWSAGVILYMIISGSLPFPSHSEEAAEKAICNGKYSFPRERFGNVTPLCKDFISKLLVKNPNTRPSAMQALEHPWLKTFKDSCDKTELKSTLTRMQTMRKPSKLKELFTTFMISQLSKTSSVRKLENVFRTIDVNGDGVISTEELIKQLSTEMSIAKAEKQAMEIMSAIDSDGSGVINYSEYIRATIEEESLLTKENLKKAFAYFDTDGSEAIELDEMKKWLSSGDIIPEDIIVELMQEADVNNDGTIDLPEFEGLLFSKLDLDEPSSA